MGGSAALAVAGSAALAKGGGAVEEAGPRSRLVDACCEAAHCASHASSNWYHASTRGRKHARHAGALVSLPAHVAARPGREEDTAAHLARCRVVRAQAHGQRQGAQCRAHGRKVHRKEFIEQRTVGPSLQLVRPVGGDGSVFSLGRRGQCPCRCQENARAGPRDVVSPTARFPFSTREASCPPMACVAVTSSMASSSLTSWTRRAPGSSTAAPRAAAVAVHGMA